jgi:hypothetical protein
MRQWGHRAMRQLVLLALLCAIALSSSASLRAHEQFRFVGYITRWDPKNQTMNIRSRETWDGKVGEYDRFLYIRPDTKITRMFKDVPQSELKVGLYVVVDASGDRIDNVDATEIEIKDLPAPAKKKK